MIVEIFFDDLLSFGEQIFVFQITKVFVNEERDFLPKEKTRHVKILTQNFFEIFLKEDVTHDFLKAFFCGKLFV